MTNKLVMQTHDESGNIIEDPVWCITSCGHGDASILCSGLFYKDWQYDSKFVEKNYISGGITCQECKRMIKNYKKVKL